MFVVKEPLLIGIQWYKTARRTGICNVFLWCMSLVFTFPKNCDA